MWEMGNIKLSVMSPPCDHGVAPQNSMPHSPGIFDANFSARSSAPESPFRKLKLSPPQLTNFTTELFRAWALAFSAHLQRFGLAKCLIHDSENLSRDTPELIISAAEIAQSIQYAVKPATLGSDFSASTLRSIMNLALLKQWPPSTIMEGLRRQLGLTSAHELETLEQELFQVTPLDHEPLSAFLLRFSVVLAQHNVVAAQQSLP